MISVERTLSAAQRTRKAKVCSSYGQSLPSIMGYHANLPGCDTMSTVRLNLWNGTRTRSDYEGHYSELKTDGDAEEDSVAWYGMTTRRKGKTNASVRCNAAS